MLSCLARARNVCATSYGCMGRSLKQVSTARARGLDRARREATRGRILVCDYSSRSICGETRQSPPLDAAARLDCGTRIDPLRAAASRPCLGSRGYVAQDPAAAWNDGLRWEGYPVEARRGAGAAEPARLESV